MKLYTQHLLILFGKWAVKNLAFCVYSTKTRNTLQIRVRSVRTELRKRYSFFLHFTQPVSSFYNSLFSNMIQLELVELEQLDELKKLIRLRLHTVLDQFFTKQNAFMQMQNQISHFY